MEVFDPPKKRRGRPKGSKNSVPRGTKKQKVILGGIVSTGRGRGRGGKRGQGGRGRGPSRFDEQNLPQEDGDIMEHFAQVSGSYVEVPDGPPSDVEPDTEEDDNNELLDPDDETTKYDKNYQAEKKKRGRKRKKVSLVNALAVIKQQKTSPTKIKQEPNSPNAVAAAAAPTSMALCPFPLPQPVNATSGRRAMKREITDEVGTENKTTICELFKGRKSLKIGKDHDSLITSKLYRIKASPWFEKRVQNYLPLAHRPVLLGLPGAFDLMQLMWLFHTNWIVNKTAEHRVLQIPVDSEGHALERVNPGESIHMDWIQKFLFYFRHYCEDVLCKGSPSGKIDKNKMKTMLDMYISIVVDVSAKEMTKVSLSHFNAFKGVSNWSETINTAIDQKDALLEKMELQHHRTMCQDTKLDESSIWGLKPLRRSFAPPYFKTSDGLAAAPALPTTGIQASVAPDAFFNFNKQKWTTKDLAALSEATKEVLIEKHLLVLQMYTDVILQDCEAVHERKMEKKREREARGEVVEEVDEMPKRRGRPKKFGQAPFLGSIAPFLCSIDSPLGVIEVRYVTNNIYAEEWRDKREDKINKYKLEDLLKMGLSVDWLAVANKTTQKTKKNRSAHDCLLAFAHENNEEICKDKWSAEERNKFSDAVKKLTPPNWDRRSPIDIDWDALKQNLGSKRTPFQLFYRWRNTIAPPKKMIWCDKRTEKTPAVAVKDDRVNELIIRSEGNWKKVAVECGNELATKKQIIDRYKKNSNSALKSGSFSRVEDALLLLTIEKLKGHLVREGHFGELIAYLPWRFETVWRDRAGNLFADWIVPWKVEEDKQLLELANTMRRNWRKIADSFNSFKNRKGCLTRYKILQRRLKTCSNVEEYHEAYSMIRYNVFQYKHLKEVLKLLKSVSKEEPLEFKGFNYASAPTEECLQDLLLSFNRLTLASTIVALEKYITGRDAYWKDWLALHGEKKKTFDRRTFHAESAQSMASALHIRGIPLKPKPENAEDLNTFEKDIYTYYAQFCKTKALKKDADRPYLPERYELIAYDTVKDVIDVTPEEIKNAKDRVAQGPPEKKRQPYRRSTKRKGNKRGPGGAKKRRKAKDDETETSDSEDEEFLFADDEEEKEEEPDEVVPSEAN